MAVSEFPQRDARDDAFLSRIDAICERFEADWKKDLRPRIEDFLQDWPEPHRTALFEELLKLDLAYRQMAGEVALAENYRHRFPEQTTCLNVLFAGAGAEATIQDRARAAEAADSGNLPARFGRYAVEEELGRGGVGIVYRGRDPDLNRSLAIKVLSKRHASEPSLKRRFLEEAQIMGQLQHPGIVPIHEIGQTADGRPYFSMKQIRGQTLGDILAETKDKGIVPADLRRLLGIFKHVCETLAYAHDRGIIHRDLKPSNIMVGAFGEVQVMDWGLAKVLGSRKDSSINSAPAVDHPSTIMTARTGLADDGKTEIGSVLGTPAYMAPEQARGEVERLDERCDVFGLGAILCEMLTGRPPFAADGKINSHRRAMKADLAEAYGLLDTCGADAPLIQLAKKCLSAECEDRPRNASAVADAVAAYDAGVQERLQQVELQRAQAETKVVEEQKRRQVELQRNRLWLSLAALIVFFTIIGGAAAFAYWQQQYRQDQQNRMHAAEVNRDVTAALDDAEKWHKELRQLLGNEHEAYELSSDIDRWEKLVQFARVSFSRAEAAAGDKSLLQPDVARRLNRLQTELKTDQDDYKLVKDLDDIHLQIVTAQMFRQTWRRMADRYGGVLQAAGMDLLSNTSAEAVKAVQRSTVKYALISFLDHWAIAANNPKTTLHLLEITRRVDPDEERNRLRNLANWFNPPALKKLSEEIDPAEHSPQHLAIFARGLKQMGVESLPLLRRTVLHYPANFWLHLNLAAQFETGSSERIASHRAALAIRPRSAVAWTGLGLALSRRQDVKGAELAFRKAVAYAPDLRVAWYNLGLELHKQGNWDDAAAAYTKAIELDSAVAIAHCNLGLVRKQQGRFAESLKAYERGHDLYAKQPSQQRKAAKWIAHCRQLIALEKKLPKLLNGDDSTPAELNDAADMCARYLNRYRDAATLYTHYINQPSNPAGDPRRGLRYRAARTALLAASGKGKQAGAISASERHSLGRQAFRWLQADLDAWKQMLKSKPHFALTYQDMLDVLGHDDAFTAVRDNDSPAKLPPADKRAWKKLWKDAELLLKNALARGKESKMSGALSKNHPLRSFDFKFSGGKTYVIELQSREFDALLRIENRDGKRLAENDDVIPGKNLNSRIVFVAKNDTVCKLIAASFNQGGRGEFQIIVREFGGDAELKPDKPP